MRSPSARSRRQTVSPSISGIITSSTTTSKSGRRADTIAPAPSVAVLTS